jgi:hypothetical protein
MTMRLLWMISVCGLIWALPVSIFAARPVELAEARAARHQEILDFLKTEFNFVDAEISLFSDALKTDQHSATRDSVKRVVEYLKYREFSSAEIVSALRKIPRVFFMFRSQTLRGLFNTGDFLFGRENIKQAFLEYPSSFSAPSTFSNLLERYGYNPQWLGASRAPNISKASFSTTLREIGKAAEEKGVDLSWEEVDKIFRAGFESYALHRKFAGKTPPRPLSEKGLGRSASKKGRDASCIKATSRLK